MPAMRTSEDVRDSADGAEKYSEVVPMDDEGEWLV